jgi:peptide/nickel transport system permease protein
VIGVVVGMVAGYNGGVVDEVLSRLTDVALCFPVLLLALGLAAACSTDAGCLAGTVHPGVLLVTLVMGLSGWPYLARLVRDQTREVRERDFVLAAHALGSRSTRILLRHVFPNLLSPVVVFVAYALPGNLLYEASLAFLGVGVPLSTPTWGNMLADSIDTATTAWWYFLAPTVAIAATAVGFNLVAEGFRKVVDAGRR